MTHSPAPRGAPRPGTRTPTGDPVLSARFAVPARPRPFVARRRLAARLNAAVRGPLTLVSGPAGSGKTVLVADWVEGCGSAQGGAPGRIAWLTAEPEDNAPGMFWAYVLEALRHQRILGPHDVGHPARPDEVNRSLLTRLAAALADLPDPVVLVLDDFDHVCSPQIAEGLRFVLGHAGGRLRLVLLGRTEPPLPLYRYRASGAMAEIRCADLAFTAAEAAELLHGHGLSVSSHGMRALIARTEGWAAGLRLSALAMQRTHDADGFLRDVEAGQGAIADFLLAEALDVHPAETQDLLLRTSILERTHPELADALTGRRDAGWILGSLRRTNAFVEPIGGSWYRHHPLFAEILRAHLRSRHPGLEPRLHRRAARWFDAHGQPGDALVHAAAAGDWEFAAGRFVDDLALGRLFTGLDTDRLRQLFSGMADDTPGTAPALVAAACRLVHQDPDAALAQLRRATAAPRSVTDAPVLLGHAFLRLITGRLLGEVGMAEAAAGEIEKLATSVPADRLERHPELRALALTALGWARLWAADFSTAQDALEQAAAASAKPGTEGPRQESLGGLAFIEVLHGRLRRAAAHARESIAAADRAGLPASGRSPAGHLALAGVAIERNELAAARCDLESAAMAPGIRHDPIMAAGLALLRSRLLLAEGDWRGSLAAVRPLTEGTARGRVPRWPATEAALAASAAHLAHGDTAAAIRAVDVAQREPSGRPEVAGTIAAARARLTAGESAAAAEALASLPPPDPAAGPALAVRTWLAQAQAAAASGDRATARRLVAGALAVARPELLRRPFLEAGPWLPTLLRGATDPRLAEDWCAGLLWRTGTGQAPPPAPQPPPEPLSAREHEVLRCAAQYMSTEEIADELCVSTNTVKTHLKSIYRKLSARRRGEAVRRARQFGLL